MTLELPKIDDAAVPAGAKSGVARFHADGSLPPASGHAWIWVFGSNEAGRLGRGAALVARQQFGAVPGCGRGPTGRSYAIPTKDGHMRVRSLRAIAVDVRAFLAHAHINPEQAFFVTRVGCGLAGHHDNAIAPLFVGAPPNCSLPVEWREHMQVSTS